LSERRAVDDVERALSQIADIHARMSASSRFRGFAPEAMAFNAVLTFGVALAQTVWPQALAGDPVRYVAVWAATMATSSLISTTETISRSRLVHGRMASAMLGSTLRLLLPFAAASIVLAVAVCWFSPASAWMLPGLWQLMVALAGFSAASMLPRQILWPATWFFFCGALVFGLGARGGAPSPWMMGIPFAMGQAGVAFILHRANGDIDGRH
jgi:hypothetical protein